MGELYRVVTLAGKYYLECQSLDTDWRLIAVKLDLDQTNKIERFEADQSQAREKLLKSLLD